MKHGFVFSTSFLSILFILISPTKVLANYSPIANAGPDIEVYEAQYIKFDGSLSTDIDGQNDIINYYWDFGDGDSSNSQIAYHNYVNNGVYTATLTVTDSSGATDFDTVIVTINNIAANIGGFSAEPNPALVGELVTVSPTFGDQGVNDTHTASWNWGDGSTTQGSITENNGSGGAFGSHIYDVSGIYTITLTLTDNEGASSQASVPVTISNRLNELLPAKIWVGLKNSDDIGIKFDIRVEAYRDNDFISSGQINSFQGGSSGFNNSHLASIPFDPFPPTDFLPGSQLKLTVYVRNACVGSGHNSGIARLWYNDNQADTRFVTKVGTAIYDNFLVNDFALSKSIGIGPKKSIDISSGTKCSAFKPFGTWSIDL